MCLTVRSNFSRHWFLSRPQGRLADGSPPAQKLSLLFKASKTFPGHRTDSLTCSSLQSCEPLVVSDATATYFSFPQPNGHLPCQRAVSCLSGCSGMSEVTPHILSRASIVAMLFPRMTCSAKVHQSVLCLLRAKHAGCIGHKQIERVNKSKLNSVQGTNSLTRTWLLCLPPCQYLSLPSHPQRRPGQCS